MIFNQPNAIDFAAIGRPAFGQAATHLPAAPTAAQVRANVRYVREAKTAAQLLPELPEPGVSLHVLMTGSYDLSAVIIATMKFRPCSHLRIATLAFSKRNAAEFVGLLESRPGLKFTMLVSSYFKANSKETFEKFADELKEYPNARLAAARSHCKVTAFDLGPGDGLTFEGSANCRKNGNLEQLCVIRDRPLHDFHARWIDRLMVNTNADKK